MVRLNSCEVREKWIEIQIPWKRFFFTAFTLNLETKKSLIVTFLTIFSWIISIPIFFAWKIEKSRKKGGVGLFRSKITNYFPFFNNSLFQQFWKKNSLGYENYMFSSIHTEWFHLSWRPLRDPIFFYSSGDPNSPMVRLFRSLFGFL